MDEKEDVIFVFEFMSIELTKVLYPNILYEFTPLIKHMHENICRKLLDGHTKRMTSSIQTWRQKTFPKTLH